MEKKKWRTFEQPDGVCFYRLARDRNFKNVTMSFKILITRNMLVSIYKNENEADIRELNWLMENAKLESWSQFHSLVDYYGAEPDLQYTTQIPYHYIRNALDELHKIRDSPDIDSIVNPIKEQLALAMSNVDLPKEIVIELIEMSEMNEESDVAIMAREVPVKETVCEDKIKQEAYDIERQLEVFRNGDKLVKKIPKALQNKLNRNSRSRKTKIKKKRLNLSLKEKVKILLELENGSTMTGMCKKYDVPVATISGFRAKKDEIFKQIVQERHLGLTGRKTLKKGF